MKRVWIVGGALVVTLGALALAMLLGSASFDYRRFSQHEGRLRKVMREAPTADRLTRALQDEGAPLLAAPRTPEEAEQVIAARGGRKLAELRQKAARYPQLRVFRAADMLYFVWFDADGVMRDFTCVSA
ncbi:MAG TPA: hypothetical protein VMX54_00820 [Vicinamibacteria bacterium]|nr:hypothetical protein [Vicinamibacteria bacterium]